MPLLIDGYNLMYAAGIVGVGRGPGGLERSRFALMRFVAESLGDAERRRTTIVFDAAGAPPGLPPTLAFEGLAIRFAKGYADADELLEELIAADHTPRKLVVVSSDHRVQRAARRRRATAVDSDVWYEQMQRDRRRPPPADSKPTGDAIGNTIKVAPSPETAADAKPRTGNAEVEFWLKRLVDDGETADRTALADIFPPDYVRDVAKEIEKDSPSAKTHRKNRRG